MPLHATRCADVANALYAGLPNTERAMRVAGRSHSDSNCAPRKSLATIGAFTASGRARPRRRMQSGKPEAVKRSRPASVRLKNFSDAS
jgi:hypothetical protein